MNAPGLRLFSLLLAPFLFFPLQAGADLAPGDPLPPFRLQAVNQKQLLTPESLGNKESALILLLNVKRCMDCIQNLDLLIRLQKKFPGELPFVAAFARGKAIHLKRYAAGLGLPFPLFRTSYKFFKIFSEEGRPLIYRLGPDGAIRTVIRPGENHPAELRRALALDFLERGKPAPARELLKTLNDQPLLAWTALMEGKLDEAQERFDALPDPLDRAAGFGFVALGKREPLAALWYADRILETAPREGMGWVLKGLGWLAFGEREKAAAALREAWKESARYDFIWQRRRAETFNLPTAPASPHRKAGPDSP